ncbi:MAG: SDR family oxidoreductase, partial [Phycisphaerae bacterium]|nr:SDR family oxidoreductase [Phycisphaerae bacterium]
MTQEMRKSQETVLVTGASAGIGLELAKLFAAAGARLVLVARRVAKLEELAIQWKQQYQVDVRVLAADLSKPQTPDEIVRTLADWQVDIDVLVNNAGFGMQGEFAKLDADRSIEMINVNISALTRLTRLMLSGMLERRRGGVLNVGSIAGFLPGPYMSVYYATKAYVISFSEALAEEVRDQGVTISCLAPGPTESEFASVAHM